MIEWQLIASIIGSVVAGATVILTSIWVGAIIGSWWARQGRPFLKAWDSTQKVLEDIKKRLGGIESRLSSVEATAGADGAATGEPPAAVSKSPLALTKKGEDIAKKANVNGIVSRYWQQIEIADGDNPYEIQQKCFDFADHQLFDMVGEAERDEIEVAAYKTGVSRGVVLRVVGIVLRDRVLQELDKALPS